MFQFSLFLPQAKLIPDEVSYEKTISILDKFRTSLGSLGLFNDINIPLVYTQVIMVAVYSFFLAEIFSSQLMAQEGGECRNRFSNELQYFLWKAQMYM